MTKGDLDYAVRQAQNNFDKWNDVAGAITKGCSWYWEAQACIEDAVKIGAKIANLGIDADLTDIIGASPTMPTRSAESYIVTDSDFYSLDASGVATYICPSCGRPDIILELFECQNCGQPVKWNVSR
jgi:hypothetical protein